MGELPRFEAIDTPEPATQESTEKETPIAKFKAEDLVRNLLNKESQEILESSDYKLPSFYLEKDVSIIDDIINDVNSNLVNIGQSIKNTAIFERDSNGYVIAKPINKKPRENTLKYI